MNGREKILLYVLVGAVVGGGLIFAGFSFFLYPLWAAHTKIVELDKDIEDLNQKVDTFNADKKRLDLARRRSLPINPEIASSEYLSYLQALLRDKKLEVKDIQPSPAVEVKPTPGFPGIKKVGHQIIAYQIRAEGELDSLVEVMIAMQMSAYEHRIKNLAIERADTQGGAKNMDRKLIISMTMETLLVSKTETKAGIPPGVNAKLLVDYLTPHNGGIAQGLLAASISYRETLPAPTASDRHYKDIRNKNIFVDATKWSPNSDEAKRYIKALQDKLKEKEKPTTTPSLPEPAGDVPYFVKLETTVISQQTAYLRNLVGVTKKDDEGVLRYPEYKISTNSKMPGYNTFKITDEANVPFFRAKVLRIDDWHVYFQVKDKVYDIKMNQSLADAMQSSVSSTRLEELKLKIDPDFAKEQAKEKGYGGSKGGRRK
jgi:outer membrane murein-binding lipoprotein Lpp